MGVTTFELNVAAVVAGGAILGSLGWAWRKAAASRGWETRTIALTAPKELAPANGFRYGLLRVRDGTDENPDRGRLVLQIVDFKVATEAGRLTADVRCSKKLGLQFKCFVDRPDGVEPAEVERVLSAEPGLSDPSADGNRPDRTWFLLEAYPLCETADRLVNNFLFPAV